MVVLEPTVAFGHGPPPASPYQIISNIRGWDLLKQVRDGDHTPLNGLVNFYPRFRPIQYALTVRTSKSPPRLSSYLVSHCNINKGE